MVQVKNQAMTQAGAPTLQRQSERKFQRILIANRGEIAVRIIRTLREMNIESVAVYGPGDENSLHVRMADWAVKLPGCGLKETYLNIPLICSAVELTQSDGVHPGYGFLAENPDFVRALEKLSGVRFIGPSPDSMTILGDKVRARALAEQLGIPILPGCSSPLSSLEELKKIAQQIGYPLVIKAAGGGGGRGMRIVLSATDLEHAYRESQREAEAFFGNDEIYCERFLQRPRHIEFQTLFDHHGHGVHLYERDCSIQRRHQKLLEEAPSEYLSKSSRAAMGAVAVKLGLAGGYSGAATVEFICERPEKFYFMEMNTRIQVEHPVTEMITGVDLIGETIKIAAGQPLPWPHQDQVPPLRGHSIEVRINAEDPSQNFAPMGGHCQHIHWPAGAFVRVDSHIAPGYTLPDLYDSMVAKIITWGGDRAEAIERMKRALQELKITGITTTAPFHLALLHHPSFIASDLATTFLARESQYFDELLSPLTTPLTTGPSGTGLTETQPSGGVAGANDKVEALPEPAEAPEHISDEDAFLAAAITRHILETSPKAVPDRYRWRDRSLQSSVRPYYKEKD